MAIVTSLSGNEVFLMDKKGYAAGNVVFGNSVVTRGFFGSLKSAGKNIYGGEIPQITEAINAGRMNAFNRMVNEALDHGASGVTGVESELRSLSGHTEFIFAGSSLHSVNPSIPFFTSAGDAQELYCHIDADYLPIQHVFGNIAYSMGAGGTLGGWLSSFRRGEVEQYSNIFNRTRHVALQRIVDHAKQEGSNAVVGIRTNIRTDMGAHEMLMTGTAAWNENLPKASIDSPVTSDLTGEELWGMASIGYVPLKLLMSTSIYSAGMMGNWKSDIQSWKKGEITPLTQLMHEARDSAVDRLRAEADQVGVQYRTGPVTVVGTKTYMAELGSGLVEFMTIGTAMTKWEGAKVNTSPLPPQAIIQDKDTWTGGYFGFNLDRK